MLKREQAMRSAVADLLNSSGLELHFFDQGRLATWVRDHPGVVVWVRARIRRELRQWKPYEQWTSSDLKYFTDEAVRIIGPHSEELNASDAMARIRSVLANPGGVVRLVGLSGVGKTRFAQALFEGDISGRPIDHTLAVYTDLGTSPYPSPLDMATELNASRRRATLVIDNCPSDAHSELVKVCLEPGSQLSLLTIEYDIQDDRPEGTNVYKFDTASEGLVRKIIRARFPRISHFDADRVARFLGGNPRTFGIEFDAIAPDLRAARNEMERSSLSYTGVDH
jgi:hypothetical protein